MPNTLTILLYHGVTDCQSQGIENFSKKHLPLEDFEKQMKYISKKCQLLSMDEVIEIHEQKKEYPKNAVAVTFDDGFKNNYSVAAPVLDAYKVPATFYITSGIINTNIMFWVDELEDCINLCIHDAITVELDRPYTFSLKKREQKIEALATIKAFCKQAPKLEKDKVIAAVIENTGVTPTVAHTENYKKMSWDELKIMHEHPLFTIGGHSLYHNILSKIESTQKLKAEIDLSIDLLEYHLEDNIIHYSYPEGQQEHYNDKVIGYLKERGIKCCPSAIDGINDLSINLFNLRRIMVGFMGTPFPF